MTGHHDVRFFPLKGSLSGSAMITTLPDDWKPFAVCIINGHNVIVARRWMRDNP